ncbi:drug/metabolite transporter (DMT)-like permease [Spirosoma lacussanchae]|uniref:EamA family transporter n=1 Tax=Spirosoma lacussanchae TaxID=1884249 RepID=UPI001108C62B|nr:EamA family transporter [Spirosoma lacussanchae]
MQVSTTPVPAASNRTTLWIALVTVYILWGSTYLFVHFMTERMPPLYMAGMRFVAAGTLLYGYARLSGAPRPTLSNWRATGLLGLLFLTVANGAIGTALHYLPTGLTALLVATLPVFVLVLNWLFYARARPTRQALAGSALGLLGVVILFQPGKLVIPGGSDGLLIGLCMTMIANTGWAFGTLLTPRVNMPASSALSSGMQMLTGGTVLILAALVVEPISLLSILDAPPKALYSLGYLIVFGSIVGFSTFSWLARNAPPTLASTYAYVNPIVAMLLGAAFAGEAISSQSLMGAAVIVAGVVLITLGKK